jgi:hypothetical protein
MRAMLYGIGVVVGQDMQSPQVLGPARAALPECYSQELSNCLDHDNANGLPKAQCDALRAPYAPGTDDKTSVAMDAAVNALPICQGPSMIPYVGAAFAVGVVLSAVILRR